jgi:hypothetical protein
MTAGNFVAWNTRILQGQPQTFLCIEIAVAHGAGLHSDADLTWSRKRNVALDNFKSPFALETCTTFILVAMAVEISCQVSACRFGCETKWSGYAS